MTDKPAPQGHQLVTPKAKISGHGVVLRQGREVKDEKPVEPEKKSD